MLTFEQSVKAFSNVGLWSLTFEKTISAAKRKSIQSNFDNLNYQTILTEKTIMNKIDDILQEKLLKKLDKLSKKIDWIGDRGLRAKLDYHATEMHKLIVGNSTNQQEMSQVIYGLISDNGDGSCSMNWFRDYDIVNRLLDNDDERFDMNEGSPAETLTFPATLDLTVCGFTFSDEYFLQD